MSCIYRVRYHCHGYIKVILTDAFCLVNILLSPTLVLLPMRRSIPDIPFYIHVILYCLVHFVSDLNEQPSGLCKDPIVVNVQTSPGSVVAILQGIDPDNENAIHRDSSNHSVIFRQKQQLTYFMSPAQNSWPFKLDQSNLFTSRVSSVGDGSVAGSGEGGANVGVVALGVVLYRVVK